MNTVEISNAIEKGVKHIADHSAGVAAARSELTRKAGELFFIKFNDVIPIEHRPDRVIECKSQGEAVFGEYLGLIERTCARSPGAFERSLVASGQALLDGFMPYVERSPVGQKMLELGRKHAEHVKTQLNNLPASERSAMALAMADRVEESRKAETEILRELEADLAEIEGRPAKRKN